MDGDQAAALEFLHRVDGELVQKERDLLYCGNMVNSEFMHISFGHIGAGSRCAFLYCDVGGVYQKKVIACLVIRCNHSKF